MSFLILILLSGCTGFNSQYEDVKVTKYKAGQTFKVDGFYSECDGVVTGHHNTKKSEEEVIYYVHFFCPGADYHMVEVNVEAYENELITSKN